jgi:hypothetical protein
MEKCREMCPEANILILSAFNKRYVNAVMPIGK